MSKFFEELKRRNVIKSTIAYLVVAWIIIQVATAVLPTFGAADWVNQAIIIVLAIGLPVWIIISWIYDITPDGIEKTPEEAEKQIYKELINKRTNAFIIASLSIAVVIMGLKMSNVFESNINDNYAIAVLPFANLSDNSEQEYFSDGISEEIINMLAQVPNLKVMGRTSSFAFKGKNMDLKIIAEQLNVNYLLEGSVRRSGNTLRITAQLINGADGSHLYSETFDREVADIFDIQDEISEDILKAIKIKLLGNKKESVFKNYTENVEAYQLYLQGRYHVNKFTPDGFLKAIEFYDKAIAIDSNYAIAYAGKSFCYANLLDFNWLASEESRSMAIKTAYKSLELDDKIFESHLAVGRIQLHQEWNIKDAMASFKRALAINPNSAEAHVQLGMCLSLYERCEEAIEHSKIAENLDPLSILNIWYLTIPIWSCQDHETVLANGLKLIEMEPNVFSGHMWAANGYLELQKYDEAITELEISNKLNPSTWTLGYLGSTYGLKGDTLQAREVIEKIKGTTGYERFNVNHSLALVYFSIGDLDAGFSYMNRALENREGQLLWIKRWFANLPEILNDPRFDELYERMKVVY